MHILGSSWFIMIISGWEFVKKDTMIPHDLESYPLHLKTVSKIKDGDSIKVLIDPNNGISLVFTFEPYGIYTTFFGVDGFATLDGDFITNTTENIWTIRKTNISLELDFNNITLLRHNFPKIEKLYILNLRSINVIWIYFTSYIDERFPWISNTVDGLQYKPHIRGNKTLKQ